MRGLTKTFAMLALAGGLAIVPAMGSQGAGALGERHVHADSHLIPNAERSTALEFADRIAERQVLAIAAS